ncbi:MAG: LamG domain-containing protein, partial [Phycisphaerales bacterium]
MYRRLVLPVVVVLLLGSIVESTSAKLVGHWRMDEGGGTVAHDTSGNGNDGTLQGGPTWASGTLDGALQFDGVDDFVEIPHSESLTVDDEVTVSAWVYIQRSNGPNGSTYQGIVAKSNGTRSYSLYLQSDGVLHFSTAGVGTTSTATVPLNEWVHVVAQVVEGGHRYFINGTLAGSGGSGVILPGLSDTEKVVIGKTWETDREIQGRIDDVRIHNKALDETGVLESMTAIPFAQALAVAPANGAVIGETQFSLTWKAGDFATSHRVSFGETFEAVDTDQVTPISTTEASLEIGQIPGYEAGLTPGTTYYWRVDEIAEGNPASPWEGPVWSFTVQPVTAWNPTPAKGTVCVPLGQELSWTAGLGAIFHTIYFSENYDEVANGTVEGLQIADAVFTPESLEAGKTYYWRVDEFTPDEFGGLALYPGEVWSFSTVPDVAIVDEHLVGWWTFDEGASDTAVDSSGYGHHGALSGGIERVEGFTGGALQFGAGKVVNCGVDAASQVTGNFTLAAWIQLDRTNAGIYGGIAGKLQFLNSNYYGFGLVRHSGGALRLWVGDGSTDLAKSAVN